MKYVLALLFLLSFALASAPVQAADRLVVTMDTAPSHLRTRMMRTFLERLEDRSGGALTSTLFDSGQLYNGRDAAKAVARGDAGLTVLNTPYLSRLEADFNVVDLPMLNGLSDAERARLFDGSIGQMLAKKLETKLGVVVPGHFWSMGKVLFFSTKKPIRTFEDLSGMQVRVPGGAALALRLKALGATPVALPATDLPLALQQGLVDATLAGADAVLALKLTDSGVRHGFWDQGIIGYCIPIVNRSYWQSLTEDERAIFVEVWNEVADLERTQLLNEESAQWQALSEMGVTMVTAAPADVARGNAAMLAAQQDMREALGISSEMMQLATRLLD